MMDSRRQVGYRTLVELLRERVLHQPDQIAYIFLNDGEQDESRLTYAELDRRARALGAELARRGGHGERAVLLFTPGLNFILAFFGCLYGGVVAVPVCPPHNNRTMPRLQNILNNSRARFALTEHGIFERLIPLREETGMAAGLEWLFMEDVDSLPDEPWEDPCSEPDTLAFLQYTSGSTAFPKGVQVTHGNILHNQVMIQQAFQHTEESSVISWTPYYHDMGLIGNILQPMYLGSFGVVMSPLAFLQRPIRWLRAITRYQGRTGGGPNFSYDLCVRKVKPEQLKELDLSSWKVAFNGAEPVQYSTIERFSEKFAPCGFRKEAFLPCYGLAEATLFVAGGGPKRPVGLEVDPEALTRREVVLAAPGTGRIHAGSGQPSPETKLAIVDPETLARCPEGRVGEIWVAGPCVMSSYWEAPEESARVVNTYISDTGEGPYLRSGDLGFMHDGELFVAGRIKDLIIIDGVNHYPQDIELTSSQSHPALEGAIGTAFSIEEDGQELLVIIQEVALPYLRNLNAEEVERAVRTAVNQVHELHVHDIVLVKTGSVPMTTSGKLQRRACKALYLSGALEGVRAAT